MHRARPCPAAARGAEAAPTRRPAAAAPDARAAPAQRRARRIDRSPPRPLGQEDHRLPDRRALRGDLAHRRAVRRARDVHRAARLGRLRRAATRSPAACCARSAGAGPSRSTTRAVAGAGHARRLPRRRAARARARAPPRARRCPRRCSCWPASRAAARGRRDRGRRRLLAAGRRRARLARAAGGLSARPPAARPPALGRAAGAARRRVRAGCSGSPRSPAGPRCPPRSRCCCAITFRHYDLVYRLRQRGVTPPRWLNRAAGRLGRPAARRASRSRPRRAVPAGFYVAAALLAVVFVGESDRELGDVRARASSRDVYEDEEEDAE